LAKVEIGKVKNRGSGLGAGLVIRDGHRGIAPGEVSEDPSRAGGQAYQPRRYQLISDTPNGRWVHFSSISQCILGHVKNRGSELRLGVVISDKHGWIAQGVVLSAPASTRKKNRAEPPKNPPAPHPHFSKKNETATRESANVRDADGYFESI